MSIESLPRDHRGRVRVWNLETAAVAERNPVDVLEGMRLGRYRFATPQELAAMPVQTPAPAVALQGTVDAAEEAAQRVATSGPAAPMAEPSKPVRK